MDCFTVEDKVTVIPRNTVSHWPHPSRAVCSFGRWLRTCVPATSVHTYKLKPNLCPYSNSNIVLLAHKPKPNLRSHTSKHKSNLGMYTRIPVFCYCSRTWTNNNLPDISWLAQLKWRNWYCSGVSKDVMPYYSISDVRNSCAPEGPAQVELLHK
jgi:hypothetical protein